MNKNEEYRKENQYALPYIIYPKEYSQYIIALILIFLSGLSFYFLAVISFKDMALFLFFLIFGSFLFAIALYQIYTLHLLIKKRIYIVVDTNMVKFIGPTKSKDIYIRNIVTIFKYSRRRRGTFLVLKCDKNHSKIRKQDLAIPIILFSIQDLRVMIDMVLDLNDSITVRPYFDLL